MTNKMPALFLAAVCARPRLRPTQGRPPPPAGFPKFKVQEIATDLKIGYAVHVCDVNGDGKPDIVVVDKERVVWYENPTWKMRTIITRQGEAGQRLHRVAGHRRRWQDRLRTRAGLAASDTKTPAPFNG